MPKKGLLQAKTGSGVSTAEAGLDGTLARGITAEMGVDMSVFGSVSQLASWDAICPGNNESGGKGKSSPIPKGNVYLNTTLIEAANAADKPRHLPEG